MKVAQILVEVANFDQQAFQTYTKEITEEQAASLLAKYCSDMINTPLFRGLERAKAPYIATDSSQIQRASRDSANSYTNLMSNVLSQWSEYPKRNRATICTNNAKYAAEMYGAGSFYFVYPENGLDIAIAPTDDIWSAFDSFLSLIDDDLDATNSVSNVDGAMDHITYVGKKLGASTFEQALELPAKKVFPRLKVAAGGSVLSFLEQYMGPRFNKFILTTTSQYSNPGGSREIWFSGKSVLIHQDYIHNMEKYFK